MCATFSPNFKNITQNGQIQSCDTIALKRRISKRTLDIILFSEMIEWTENNINLILSQQKHFNKTFSMSQP